MALAAWSRKFETWPRAADEVRLGPPHALRHLDVGVLADRLEALSQVFERDSELDQPSQPRVGREEEALREAVPRVAPRRSILRLVHLHEAGVHARLDGTLSQEARAEGVDRADEAGVQMREPGRQVLAAHGVLFFAREPIPASSGSAGAAARRPGS